MCVNNDCVWYKDVCELYDTTDCTHTCIRYMEMRRLCELSNIPKNKWKLPPLYCIDKDKNIFKQLGEVKEDIVQFVETGNNLYLYSEYTGNGKTSWAIRLMLAYFNDIWSGNGFNCRGVFVSVPDFLFKQKEIINNFDDNFNTLKKQIQGADLVIWDDIAVTPLTQYEHQLLLTYIDNRVLNNKSNIYTGNANRDTLDKYLGLRLASRVWNTSIPIHFQESDKRRVGGGRLMYDRGTGIK